MWIKRKITDQILASIKRGKSVILLGPRQTGKTSLVMNQFNYDLYINLMESSNLNKYESQPELLLDEIRTQKRILKRKPLIIIDEVQKIPNITDNIQVLIDEGTAQFIITGSSARKIKNLLPGRVIKYVLMPISIYEIDPYSYNLEELLFNGTLPEVILTKPQNAIDELLESYVNLYIEEEIRKESLVRNLNNFTNFFQLACLDSGSIVSLRAIASEIGVSHNTIAEYYRILEDCMLIKTIMPLTKTTTRRRLSKSPKHLIFDMGIKRVGACEYKTKSIKVLSQYFEHYIGLELSKITKVMYWRSHDGPEVDFIIEENNQYIPIEVKWTKNPTEKDIRHIKLFLSEYQNTDKAFIICRCDKPRYIADNILAIPWQELDMIF